MAKELSAKWKKFIAAYDGDVPAACSISGIAENYAYRKMRTDPRIMEQIRIRTEQETEQISTERKTKHDHVIATRQDRQDFWTEVMQDKDENMTHRLRAAELLGKSEADFTEKVEHSGGLTVKTTRKRFDGSDY